VNQVFTQWNREAEMNWKELLSKEIEYTYEVTGGLLDLVDDSALDWKPSSENNWMTTGQLLMHITHSCGQTICGFVTGDWGMPEGVDINELPSDEMLPQAELLPAVESVEQAKELLEKDMQLALGILAGCDEDKLAGTKVSAPWDPTERLLGGRLLEMVQHLSQHKSQLFYYLKLQGKAVNTSHLWGM
jgi:DinB family protein